MTALTPVAVIIAELILKYGLDAAIKIIKALNKDTITIEDIEALRDLVKHPDDYLKEDKI